jgi:anti-sigma regulatory factor (Ser/Thr protein kinase)
VLGGVQFSIDDLREVRRVTAQWAARAGLPAHRADDFVIAVNEITTNAVRYGSPVARLELRVAGGCAVEAEVGDDGCWLPGPRTPAGHERGGMGIAVARRVCDAVDIQAGADGTTVILRMRLPDAEPPGQSFA